MPLAGNYTWEETPETLVLVIPLKGASYKQTDVFLAETIVKVSYAPFLLDLTLFKSIEYNEGTAIKKDDKLYLELVKRDKGIIWGSLLFDGTPQEIEDRRRTALESRIVMVRDRHEAARKYKWEEEQLAVRKQIELETLECQRIEKLKEQEKDEEALQLFRAVEMLEPQNRSLVITTKAQEQDKEAARNNKQIVPPCSAESSAAPVLAPPRMPKPRSKKVVTIQLTPRIFNTPMRESTFEKEQAFIVKNRPFLKTNRLLNNNTLHYNDNLAETNSLWLKSKGDEFYKRKDYSSAVNAYTRAFEQSSTNLMNIKVVANRAACYLQLGESYRCAADCEYVLNMMKKNDEASPSVMLPNYEDALILEQKILSRLAWARCQLGNFGLALDLLERQYLGLDTNKISHDLTLVLQQNMELVSLWHQSSVHKLKADEKLSSGYCEEALELYNEALLLNPFSVSALANRAACYMVQKEFSLCIDDCNTAAEILEANPSQTSAAPFPIHSCLKRLEWIVTIRLRQCAAKELNKDFTGALSDIESIIAFIGNRPSFTTVKRELEIKRFDFLRPQQ